MTLPWAGVTAAWFPFWLRRTAGSFDSYRSRCRIAAVFVIDLVRWNFVCSSSNLTSSCWIVPRLGFGFELTVRGTGWGTGTWVSKWIEFWVTNVSQIIEERPLGRRVGEGYRGQDPGMGRLTYSVLLAAS